MSLQSDARFADLVKAGAVSQMCTYWKSLGGRDMDWAKVHVYALREFRAIDPVEITKLIEYSRRAADAARIQMNLPSGQCLKDCDIPKME